MKSGMALWDDLVGAFAADDPPIDTTRVPTRYLGGAPDLRRCRHGGISGALPRVPRVVTSGPSGGDAAQWDALRAADRATQRRRRLLAVFGRMMARFYEHHERQWSMGRWECSLCRQRIVAWAWVSHLAADGVRAMHEACVSSRMWEAVIYHEQMVRAGLLGGESSLAGMAS
jgi:hypothetical protein